jgi:hypothetical protein
MEKMTREELLEIKKNCIMDSKGAKAMDTAIALYDELDAMKAGIEKARKDLLATFCYAGYVKKEGLNTEQRGNLQEVINKLASIGGKEATDEKRD